MSDVNPLDDTPEDTPNYGQNEIFQLALGRFMIAWADAELELYRVLISYSGVTNPVARAIFSGTRAKAMMDFIRNIIHNTQLLGVRKADLDHVFPQMAAINTMRDHLAHHASDSYSFPKGDPFTRVIANVRSSRYGNNVGFEISSETINAMTWDLYGIANHLNMHHGSRTEPFTPWRENPEFDVPTAWLYTPPQPIQKWEQFPPALQAQPHQPKSSLE